MESQCGDRRGASTASVSIYALQATTGDEPLEHSLAPTCGIRKVVEMQQSLWKSAEIATRAMSPNLRRTSGEMLPNPNSIYPLRESPPLFMFEERRIQTIALALILLIGLAFRLNNIGFGLPSLWDPDEPIFMLIPIDMLRDGSLNPGWFGHPGSTTIYLIAIIDCLVVGFGRLSGLFPDTAAFAHAVFEDPALIFIPARVAMALIGVGTVWLTYLVGRRLYGALTGLIAALLLAINGLHVVWSQVIRTDINASLFMLACLLFSIRAGESGRFKDYVLAGMFAGLATVTKWPAVTVLLAVIGAAGYRGFGRRDIRNLLVAFAAFFGAMFVASPFIFIDWQTVIANVHGEAQSSHLGHTAGGFMANLRFYLIRQIDDSMGFVGTAATLTGTVLSAMRSRPTRWILLPSTAVFLTLICTQHVVWSRWVLPLLPAYCIFAAVAAMAFVRTATRMVPQLKRPIAVALAAAVLAVPSLALAIDLKKERANDTRGQAALWAREHIPPGSTVVLENLELSLRHQPWKILFPVGKAGCVDALKALGGGVRYQRVQQLRGNSAIVDIGNVSPDRIASCHADYAILSYFDLYRTEGRQFPKEIKTYDLLLGKGRTVALFAPQPGRAGGPTVRIVALSQH